MLLSNLNKVRQLPAKDRRWLFQSVLLLPVIHLALLLLGYSRLQGMMEKLAPLRSTKESVSDASLQRAREIARLVSIAAQHGPYKANCLRKSLLVWWFLRREGIPSEIRFGVRIVRGKIEAHAWLEYHSVIVNDSASVRHYYQTLYRDVLPTQPGL